MKTSIQAYRLGGAALLAVLGSACASNPAADQKIAVARSSLERAEQAGAPQVAPVEMAAARDKLARAEKANADHEGAPALALADQADLDAQVAEAAAQQQKSHKAAMDLEASLQALRQETQRNTAPAQ